MHLQHAKPSPPTSLITQPGSRGLKRHRQTVYLPALLIGLVLFAAWCFPAFSAERANSAYRDLSLVGSRNLVWIVAQLHILFAGFVVGVPIFAWVCEIIGAQTKNPRYDKLAKEFTKLLIASFGTTATLGAIFLFLLLGFYPQVMNYLTDIFLPTYYVYVLLFLGETATLYLYWYGWEAMQQRKGLHLFLGFLLNVFGFLIMIVANAWTAYQSSPVVLAESVSYWQRIWLSVNNPTWWPLNLHRFIGNVVVGGFMCGAYAALRYLGSKTDSEREHYDWMGYVGNFVGIFALLPLPFLGYWLTMEIYRYNQQMGITLMGGFLSWLFILQAVLIGVLFLGVNYYFWQGLLHRTTVGMQHRGWYQRTITLMLIVIAICFGVWITPHSLVATLEEARRIGGIHHPILGVFGVMSAKMTAVNILILTTLISFLLYWRANLVETVRWARAARAVQGAIFILAFGFVLWAGIYGYFVPAIVRIYILSVGQVLVVLFTILSTVIITALSLRNARMVGEMRWGRIPPSSQYALLINAVMVILLMAMMGYARSASRVHWHIYGVLEDTSPHAYTPALGQASLFMSLSTVLFFFMVAFIFWVVSLPEKAVAPVETALERPKFFRKAVATVCGILIVYTYLAYQIPQKASLPPEKEAFDLKQLTSQRELVRVGQKIFFGKGQCALCHSLSTTAAPRAPDLRGIGGRLTAEFIYQTLTEPDAYIKPDFQPIQPKPYPTEMPAINRPPINLSEEELLAVIAFLQSLGGKVTIQPADLIKAARGETG